VKLAVLGSGSRGNALAIHTDGATLLVDAGFGLKTLRRRAEDAGIPLAPLSGVVLTHEHGDHTRHAVQVAAAFGCPVFASSGTIARVRGAGPVARLLPPVGRSLDVGPFRVSAARTAHDASEPVAIAIADDAGTKVGIAYDLGRPTVGVRHLLRNSAALVLEANHDEVMLRTGPYPPVVQDRIAGAFGHLSNRAAADLAAELCGPALELVVLVHISEQCTDPGLARQTVAAALTRRRFKGKLLIAEQDHPLEAVSLRRAPQLMLSFGEPPSPPPAAPPPPAPIPGSYA
jgi:phosphoribosyl 1,2-cyclic phosphodiesterase